MAWQRVDGGGVVIATGGVNPLLTGNQSVLAGQFSVFIE
jgi:hypothetical protein